jgi:hypothetical protein
MKNISFAILIVALSGCCFATTRDCNCTPPIPELSAEALSWMEPYQIQPYSIYKNEAGTPDTISIRFETGTEFCGGDECGSDCELQRAILTSSAHPEFDFTISAEERYRIMINGIGTIDSILYAELNPLTKNVFSVNLGATVTLEQNFEWKNQHLTVLKIDCNNPVDCSKYSLTNMLISEEHGLLEYRFNSGETWQKQD